MATHVRKSAQLLRELKMARWLPQFNDKLVKEVVEEIHSDTREMRRILMENGEGEEAADEEKIAAGLCLFNDFIDRNRRCLLAYLNYRLERVEELRWEVGYMVPEEMLDKLHDTEKQYLEHYNAILDRYQKTYVPNCKAVLDLTADAEAPEEMNVQIRVMDEGLGELVTPDSGIVRLRRGYQLFVKRTDVEHLIRAGQVEHVRTLRVDDIAAGV